MPHNTAAKPLLLLGAYGRGNAGDDVFILSAASLFAGRTLYINSADDSLLPAEARGVVRTISTISPRDIAQKVRLFWAVKDVVYWGGDLWVLLYGTRRPRQLLYKMLGMNLVLRLAGKRIYYIGCGIGDLHGYSRWLARSSARLARQVVVREARSAHVLGLPRVRVMPDLAVNLPYHQPKLHRLPAKRPFRIVVAPLWSIPNPAYNFPRLLNALAALVESLPAKHFTFILLPMHITGEEHDDLWACRQLARRIKGHQPDIYTQRDLPSIIRLLRESDVVIGARLHANVLALLNGTPAIGVSYRPKVRSFFAANHLGDFCLGLEDIDELPEIFRGLHERYDAVAHTFYEAALRNLSQRTDYAELIRDI